MTINYTTLLSLAEPVTGTESGTWGDDVNKGITDYLDIAVAGTQTISGSQTAVTLSKTQGSASGNNIAQAGFATTGTAQYAIINCTGSPASTLTVTVPASSKNYVVINATSTSQLVKIVGAGPTPGVTLASGEKALVAWNGSDFVKVGVAEVAVSSANGFAGTSSGGTSPALTLSTTVTGIVKGNGTALSAATAGTDYLAPPSGSAIQKANSGGALANAVAGTDYIAPPSGTAILKANSGGALANAVAGTDYVSPNGSETLTNKTLTNPTVTNYVETPYSANTGTALTIDLANGTVQILTATGNSTITMPTATAGKSFIVYFKTGAGGFTAAFTGVKWANGATPTITATASRVDIYSFFADGTNWYGVTVGQNYTP